MTIDKEYIQSYIKKNNLEFKEGIIPVSRFSESERELYKDLSLDILKKNFDGNINIFIPGKHFTSLSVTGSSCDLNCEHCHTHYLNHMEDVSSADKLRKSLDTLVENGALGCLISGGCDSDGRVPILQFSEILKEYKEKTSLIFNFHVGLINEEEIQKLADIQPDFVSFDLTLDNEAIRDVYHLNRSIKDYVNTYRSLIEHGVRTIPHICIGLNFGDVKKEAAILHEIAKYPVDLIVFLIIIPPPDHPTFHNANVGDVGDIFTTARLLFPHTELSLGCMRPRDAERRKIEELAVHAGFNRFEIPSKKTLKLMKSYGLSTNTFNVCCAVSQDTLQKLSKP